MENEPATEADVKAALEGWELRLLERVDTFEHRLVTEFRKWAAPDQSLVKVNETYAVGFDARLSLVEERLSVLERR